MRPPSLADLLDPLAARFARLSPRERRLTLLTGGVAFLLLNLFVVNYLFNARRELAGTLAAKRMAASNARLLLEEAPRWQARDEWLRAHQPRLTVSPQVAGSQLLTQIEELAKARGVSLENQQILPPDNASGNPAAAAARPYRSIAVSVLAKGKWPALVGFLAALQADPNAFLVPEACTLRTEPNDAAAMRGELRIAKWYAPAGS